MQRIQTPMDLAISTLDMALRSLFAPRLRSCKRQNPAHDLPEPVLTREEKRHVSGLMRVNHAGEVCAQALYQGQAITAQLTTIRDQMTKAAEEEVDHLAWCEDRLRELDSATGWLNPFWYLHSFLLGLMAGWIGDRWSLGFVAETERQVTAHLQAHLQHLPIQDEKSKAILLRMQQDEQHHAEVAEAAGAAELPLLVKQAMRLVSLLMTKTSYYF